MNPPGPQSSSHEPQAVAGAHHGADGSGGQDVSAPGRVVGPLRPPARRRRRCCPAACPTDSSAPPNHQPGSQPPAPVLPTLHQPSARNIIPAAAPPPAGPPRRQIGRHLLTPAASPAVLPPFRRRRLQVCPAYLWAKFPAPAPRTSCCRCLPDTERSRKSASCGGPTTRAAAAAWCVGRCRWRTRGQRRW